MQVGASDGSTEGSRRMVGIGGRPLLRFECRSSGVITALDGPCARRGSVVGIGSADAVAVVDACAETSVGHGSMGRVVVVI